MSLLNTRLVIRNDSVANWDANKERVLHRGELAIAFDEDNKSKLKIGDGVTKWGDLGWFAGDSVSGEEVSSLKAQIDALSARVGTPADEDSDPTGIYGEIAALADSLGLLIEQKIEEFGSQITDDGKINTVMELIHYVDEHGKETAALVSDVRTLQEIVGTTPVAEQIDAALKPAIEKLDASMKHIRYEIVSCPENTEIFYGEDEIRVMCPADTAWAHQQSGENADSNLYYIGFKAYAPSNAVSFKEDLAEIIADNTMYSFDNNEFAGVDRYGRKYSIVWLPVARFDPDTNTWMYYGDMSSKQKYIGWYYSVEWYDAAGKLIASDITRVNLSNAACHHVAQPYYMSDVIKEISLNGTLLDVVDNKVDLKITGGVVSGDEIVVNEDGTLSIAKIDMSKLYSSSEGTTVVLNGGSAFE